MKGIFKIFLLALILLVLFSRNSYADGVQLSSTAVGSTATFTSQLPADPCGVHKLGETRTRTVYGFTIDTTPFNMGSDGVMRLVTEKRADLTNAVVVNITIAGKQITDFSESPDDHSPLNWQDVIDEQREFNLKQPIEFTPQDTASIVVTNVKILNSGTINPWFGLTEEKGQFCLNSKYTILTLGGESSQPLLSVHPTETASPTKALVKPTQTVVVAPTTVKLNLTPTIHSKSNHKTGKSLLDYINDFLRNFLRKG